MTNHKFALGLKPHTQDTRDFPLCASRFAIKAVPDLIDLSLIDAWQQAYMGFCYAHGMAAAYMLEYYRQTGKLLEPSRLYNAIMTKVDEGTLGQDSGATGRGTVKAAVKYGMVEESRWPYDLDAKTVWTIPPADVQTHGELHQVLKYYWIAPGPLAGTLVDQSLVNGFGVLLGLALRQEWMSDDVAKTGIIPVSKSAYAGGHMMFIDGREPGFKQVRNSWGPEWGCKSQSGKAGYCKIPDSIINSGDVMFLAVVTAAELGE